MDKRYEHVTCAACGQRIQRIDFRAALHIFTCPNYRESK